MSTSLSSFPNSVDTFKRYSDLTADTMVKAERYKEFIETEQYETAMEYLNLKENEDLRDCGINAEIINKHSDAIVEIEKDINNTKSQTNFSFGVTDGNDGCSIDVKHNGKQTRVPIINGTNISVSASEGSQTVTISSPIVYNTTEKVIGTYMGKTLYQKVFQFNSSNMTFDFRDYNIIEITGGANYKTEVETKMYYPIGYTNINNGHYLSAYRSVNGFISIDSSATGLTLADGILIVKYTKN